MLLGNRSSTFEDADIELPKRSGWYAVRNTNWPKGCFVEASFLADSASWIPVDGITDVAQWRYLSPMEKSVVGIDQAKVSELGSRPLDKSLFEMLTMAADLSILPKARPQLISAGYSDNYLRNVFERMKAYGIKVVMNNGKPYAVLGWGMFDKLWVYRNYEVMKRKIEE